MSVTNTTETTADALEATMKEFIDTYSVTTTKAEGEAVEAFTKTFIVFGALNGLMEARGVPDIVQTQVMRHIDGYSNHMLNSLIEALGLDEGQGEKAFKAGEHLAEQMFKILNNAQEAQTPRIII